MVHIGNYWKTGFIVQGVWAFVASLFVFTRLITRYYLGPQTDRLGYDDWLLLTAWILFAIRGILVMASFFPMVWGYSILEYYMSPDYWIGYRAELLFGLGLFVGCFEDGIIRVAIAAFLYRLAVEKKQVQSSNPSLGMKSLPDAMGLMFAPLPFL
ncbi:hypothetical protein V8F33_011441 [Rhypophila sp. PSN 637]